MNYDKPQGRLRAKWRDYKSLVVWECFRVLQEGQGNTAGEGTPGSTWIRTDGGSNKFHLLPGIIGGMTSIITSTVEGVKTEGGVSGFFSGLGKGLVGTVTKPVAGALDFASETAQTVRDMASLSNHRWVCAITNTMVASRRLTLPSLFIELWEVVCYSLSRWDGVKTFMKH